MQGTWQSNERNPSIGAEKIAAGCFQVSISLVVVSKWSGKKMKICATIPASFIKIQEDLNCPGFIRWLNPSRIDTIVKDMTIVFSDSTESSPLEPGCDTLNTDDNDSSIHIDIGQLGAVMYEATTGDKSYSDLFKDQPQVPLRAVWS
ncbi:uncharacterized protein Z519_07494 [Cladophialophora bantiana CBS 173.52]|uniref:Uncharacterized protein n=1 Tax=Cladophialophora bantiana (strain ATCC 10958 / CBS 173.52 / CDC B-1940 / NIH 8579) TaxID=1442370 RepID=A0A0D2HE26_CLAB1|nr:uncharacterized protein Z519_07494 [Cladophialophora bantiana CBS 173.52]KIW91528.1 hypothetical protein Z519_07494 [Cladophialophora bantiana CBS 173.52]